MDGHDHLRRRDFAVFAALPLLTLSILLWSLTVHPYCHIHLACDGPDDPSKMRILWSAAIFALVAVVALLVARMEHRRAKTVLPSEEIRLVQPRNVRSDWMLLAGAVTSLALFGVTYWVAWTTQFGDIGPDLLSMEWALLAAAILVLGNGCALRSFWMKPPSGLLQRCLVLPVVVVGAFAALFSWAIFVVGPLV